MPATLLRKIQFLFVILSWQVQYNPNLFNSRSTWREKKKTLKKARALQIIVIQFLLEKTLPYDRHSYALFDFLLFYQNHFQSSRAADLCWIFNSFYSLPIRYVTIQHFRQSSNRLIYVYAKRHQFPARTSKQTREKPFAFTHNSLVFHAFEHRKSITLLWHYEQPLDLAIAPSLYHTSYSASSLLNSIHSTAAVSSNSSRPK